MSSDEAFIADGVKILDPEGNPIDPAEEGTLASLLSAVAKEGTLASLLASFPNSTRDAGNQTTTSPGPNSTYAGDFVDVSQYGSLVAVVISSEQLAGAFVEWSDDGTTPLPDTGAFDLAEDATLPGLFVYFIVVQETRQADHARIQATTTANDPAVFETQFYLNRNPFAGFYLPLGEAISPHVLFHQVRAVIAGQRNDGLLNALADDFGNVELMPNGGIKTGIPWDVLYQTATPGDVAIPSGALPAIDPVLNTEPNVRDSGWLPVVAYPGGQFLNAIANRGLKVFLLNASDDQGNNLVGDAAPILELAADVPGTTGAPFFDGYFRIVIVNDTGASATEYSIRSMGLQTSPPEVLLSLGQAVSTFFPAPLVQAFIKARNSATGLADLLDASPSGSLQVAQTDRPSELRSRVAVHLPFSNIAADTVLYTVPAGGKFYLTNEAYTAFNDDFVDAFYAFADDGTEIRPKSIPRRIVGSLPTQMSDSGPITEPPSFSTNVEIIILAGSPNLTGSLHGYWEPDP